MPSSQSAAEQPAATAEPGPAVRVKDVLKDFSRGSSTGVIGLDKVSLDVNRGEFLVILGPSGCGKTTLLRCIAGLETPDSGEIEINGVTVFGGRRSVPTERRGISMMFQSYALWPHMTVFANVAYPLKTQRLGTREVRPRVERILELVGIAHLAQRHPGQLSGGQQQRVALARALVSGSEVVLFDEPLSNVDAKVREELRSELLVMQRELGFVAIYVTHDQDEALALADRVALFDQGTIAQLAPPQELYERPSSLFAASFVGVSNSFEGSVVEIAGDGTEALARIQAPFGEVVARTPSSGWDVGTSVRGFVRPHAIQIDSSPSEGVNVWNATVVRRSFRGSYSEYLLSVDDMAFRVWTTTAVTLSEGSTVTITVEPDAIRAFPTAA